MLPIRTNLPVNVLRVMVNRLHGHDPAKVLANIDIVTENIYGKLPSGDYGRGDVRTAIGRWADVEGVLQDSELDVGVMRLSDGVKETGWLVTSFQARQRVWEGSLIEMSDGYEATFGTKEDK